MRVDSSSQSPVPKRLSTSRRALMQDTFVVVSSRYSPQVA
jgi:hypothetical protein